MGVSFPFLMMQTPAGAGYVCGGWAGSGNPITTITRINFNTLVVGNISDTLSQYPMSFSVFGRYPIGASSSSSGYVMAIEGTVDKIAFSTSTRTTLSGKSFYPGGCGIQSSTYGYTVGGVTGGMTVDSEDILSLSFTTEARADTGSNVPSGAGAGNQASFNSDAYGYIVGGVAMYSESPLTTVTRMAFSNNAVSARATTGYQRNGVGFDSPIAGYAMLGLFGSSPALSLLLETMPFATETFSILSQQVSTARIQGCAVRASGFSCIEGGNNASSTYYTTGEVFQYATETIRTETTALGTARSGQAGVQSGYR